MEKPNHVTKETYFIHVTKKGFKVIQKKIANSRLKIMYVIESDNILESNQVYFVYADEVASS